MTPPPPSDPGLSRDEADCVFCRIVRGEAPASKVLETDDACAFLTHEPASDYHTLVVPRRHVVDLFDATPADVLGVATAVKAVVDLYRERLGLENVEVASNSGADAQQGVFHLHVRVVPRHPGDGQDTHWARRAAPDALDARLARIR